MYILYILRKSQFTNFTPFDPTWTVTLRTVEAEILKIFFLKKEHSASAQKLDVSYKKKECNCNHSLDLQSCKSS